LRDDDNIYLDSVKNGLKAAREETAKRLSANLLPGSLKRTAEKKLAENIPELHSPAINGQEQSYNDKSVKFRQLTGQPAGKGIARGSARVIHEFNDLYDFQKGEVLVCDAVEPSMTIVAPLAAAVIERRGGMLIHGAIIAREYGLPCVTGVPEATGKIKNGDLLSVDGWLGIVTIL
jgi:pyruvate,water dikinase